PLMVKTPANPGGLPLDVFDGFRASLLADRAQFFRDVPSGPFYGFNRPGTRVSQGVIDNWWRQGMMCGVKSAYDCIKAFSETDFTSIHVIISLIGIFSGLVVLAGLLTARRFDGWTAVFLTSAVLTSVTSFFFPCRHFTPAHGVGILSLLLLSITLYARYGQKL